VWPAGGGRCRGPDESRFRPQHDRLERAPAVSPPGAGSSPPPTSALQSSLLSPVPRSAQPSPVQLVLLSPALRPARSNNADETPLPQWRARRPDPGASGLSPPLSVLQQVQDATPSVPSPAGLFPPLPRGPIPARSRGRWRLLPVPGPPVPPGGVHAAWLQSVGQMPG